MHCVRGHIKKLNMPVEPEQWADDIPPQTELSMFGHARNVPLSAALPF